MSNIRQRGDKWQARVTVSGETVTKTFSQRADAEKWARHQQVSMERGEYLPSVAATVTLAEVIERYEREVLPSKRGRGAERYVLAAWRKSVLGKRTLASIKPSDIAQARDRRLKEVSPSSVRRYLDILSGIFAAAIRDWELVSENPVKAIRKPANAKARTRRLLPGELDRIIAATESPDLPAIVTLAVESAMRRSEILGLEWRHIDLRKRFAHLPLTKNGEARTVPLSVKAVETLAALPRRIDGKVFCKNGTSLSGAFQRAVRRARVAYEKERVAQGATEAEVAQDLYLLDLRLHDLRHECVSRLVEGGFNLIEAAAVSGHRTMSCLKRYSHIRAEHLIEKLDALPAKIG